MGFSTNAFRFAYRVLRWFAVRLLPRNAEPRAFSNIMIKKYAQQLAGSVVNVSGWDDRDGEGGFYRDYFTGKTRYTVTNMGVQDKGFGSLAGTGVEERELDLTSPLTPDLQCAFDVVFNHTTLEHIFEFETACMNLCAMSRDAIIIVVPVLQQIHTKPSFGDYWRPTTLTIAKTLSKHGFTPLVLAVNDQPFFPQYCFVLAVREPQRYEQRIERSLNYQMGSALFGSSLKKPIPDAFVR